VSRDDDVLARRVPHAWYEDLLGLISGLAAASLGLYLLKSCEAVTGGTAGLSLLVSYWSGASFELLFVLINLPFAVLALWKKGWAFTVKSLACIVALSLLTKLHANVLGLGHIQAWYGVVLGNLLVGMGLLILFRHGASLGGFNVVVLLAQEVLGWRAGYVQMCLDVTIVLLAFAVVPVHMVLLSALGAVIVNLVLALNHRPGRYMGL